MTSAAPTLASQKETNSPWVTRRCEAIFAWVQKLVQAVGAGLLPAGSLRLLGTDALNQADFIQPHASPAAIALGDRRAAIVDDPQSLSALRAYVAALRPLLPFDPETSSPQLGHGTAAKHHYYRTLVGDCMVAIQRLAHGEYIGAGQSWAGAHRASTVLDWCLQAFEPQRRGLDAMRARQVLFDGGVDYLAQASRLFATCAQVLRALEDKPSSVPALLRAAQRSSSQQTELRGLTSSHRDFYGRLHLEEAAGAMGRYCRAAAAAIDLPTLHHGVEVLTTIANIGAELLPEHPAIWSQWREEYAGYLAHDHGEIVDHKWLAAMTPAKAITPLSPTHGEEEAAADPHLAAEGKFMLDLLRADDAVAGPLVAPLVEHWAERQRKSAAPRLDTPASAEPWTLPQIVAAYVLWSTQSRERQAAADRLSTMGVNVARDVDPIVRERDQPVSTALRLGLVEGGEPITSNTFTQRMRNFVGGWMTRPPPPPMVEEEEQEPPEPADALATEIAGNGGIASFIVIQKRAGTLYQTLKKHRALVWRQRYGLTTGVLQAHHVGMTQLVSNAVWPLTEILTVFRGL